MAATYDASTIATNMIAFARSLFRDIGGLSGTTVTKPLLLDEEYQGYIDRLGEQEGLAKLAESLASTYAQKIQRYGEAGGIAIEWPKRETFYLDLAKSIRDNGLSSASGQIRGGGPTLPTPLNDARLQLERISPYGSVIC